MPSRHPLTAAATAATAAATGAALLLLPGCAADAEAPAAVTPLDPAFVAREGGGDTSATARRRAPGRSAARRQRTGQQRAGAGAPGGSDPAAATSAPSAGTAPTAGDPAPPGTPAAGPATSSSSLGSLTGDLADARGDVAGLERAEVVDLVAASLRAAGGTYRVTLRSAAPWPARAEGGRTVLASVFLDTDLDGDVDHQLTAALADDGWSGSRRSPDGARFGEASGVRVEVAGDALTLVVAADLVGGTARRQWSAGAQHGTPEQLAAGTDARDLAPDAGGAVVGR